MSERKTPDERTFRNEGLETYRRVYYAITQDEGRSQAHYTAAVVSRLVHVLVEKGVLTEHELDELLFEAIG